MASYVYQVKLELSSEDKKHHPREVVSILDDTILYKCERKARKFIESTINQYYKTGEWEVWQPDKNTWCVDQMVVGSRLSLTLSEIRVIT